MNKIQIGPENSGTQSNFTAKKTKNKNKTKGFELKREKKLTLDFKVNH